MSPMISMRREIIEIEPTAEGIQRVQLGGIKSYLWGVRIPMALALWSLRQFFGLEVI